MTLYFCIHLTDKGACCHVADYRGRLFGDYHGENFWEALSIMIDSVLMNQWVHDMKMKYEIRNVQ